MSCVYENEIVLCFCPRGITHNLDHQFSEPGPQSAMAVLSIVRRLAPSTTRSPTLRGGDCSIPSAYCSGGRHFLTTVTLEGTQRENEKNNTQNKGKWLTLPPFTTGADGAALGKNIAGKRGGNVDKVSAASSTPSMTAIKWVMRCCPELPRSLVQKLFRLRKVRRELSDVQVEECQSKRVAAKDMMNSGDKLHLPVTVEKSCISKPKCTVSDEEEKFLLSLILYKDPAIIVVNKPHGMPVQGGMGIKSSLDELSAKYLRLDVLESPRLVHRLDRDCSGVLVMGRSQLSASTLHSLLREKTFQASNSEIEHESRIMKKTYQALVIGTPRRLKGLISVPLGKVVMDNGKSERVTSIHDAQSPLAQHAVTEYRVIETLHGYTWLELSPVTGRKHQLRVHCAEVLGTPIVGDHKYGWQAHKKWKPFPCSSSDSLTSNLNEEIAKRPWLDPFGLNMSNGSISDKKPHLHLHCWEITLPDICLAMKLAATSQGNIDIADLQSIKLNAPLSPHLQKSWDLLKLGPS